MLSLEGKKCILDSEGPELELAAKGAHPFLIKPNLHEMETTLGLELRTMRSIRDAALLFIRLGVEHAVISMGAMGAMYVDRERTLLLRPCGWPPNPRSAPGMPCWAECSWDMKGRRIWGRPSGTASRPARPA